MNTSRRIVAKAEVETNLREAINNEAEEHSKDSVFETLRRINVNEHTEKKGGLTYLPWAWAWDQAKVEYPGATYTIYENPDGWPYFTDGRTCWVKTGVTIEGLEHIEYLPVMDYRNQSIPVGKVTSMDVNKTIQRSLTKALARHGLGLYIYAGEDLPEAPAPEAPVQATAPKQEQTATGAMTPEHTKAYRQAMATFDQKYQSTMGEPLYKAVLREMGVKTFTVIPDARFPEIMEKIDALRRLVQE